MQFRIIGGVAIVILTFILAVPQKSRGAEEEKFPARTITWLVNASPGGGFDLHSRAVARSMRRILGVPIIVKNVPGAGGNISWNLLWASKPDGYTVGIVNIPGAIVSQLYGKPKPQYDLKKFTWLGRISAGHYVWAVGAKTPFQNLKDLQKAKEVLLTDAGVGNTSWVTATLTAATMGFKPKFILGYGGAPAANLGIVRGEGEARALGLDSPGQMRFIREGLMRPLWVYLEHRDPAYPDVPTVGELGYSSLTPLASHRVVAAPPGLPADRFAVLEKAFIQAVRDPETQEAFKKMKAKTSLVSGQDWVPVLDSLFTLIQENGSVFEKYLK
jgi:tripartite-type tricarboxylate transporter receptor subunit TctC